VNRPYSAGLSIDEIKQKYGLKKVIKLASNENNFGIPLSLQLFLSREIPQLYRYPDNHYPKLKKSLSRHFGLEESNILLGNGSDEILFNLITYFVPKNREILIPKPSFQMYSIVPKNNDKQYVEVPLLDYEYDLSAFIKKIRKTTSMIILCNPNNPTGTYITERQLADFLSTIPSRILVIVDEAYHQFADTSDFPDSIALMKKYPNLIILRTFSKFFSLAGLRLGFGFAHKNIIDKYAHFKIPFSINRLSENIGSLVFSKYDEFRKNAEKIIREKAYFYKEFDRLNVSYKKTQGNFIFLYNLKDSKKIFEKLLEKGIIIRELEGFGLKGCLRITIGKPDENRAFIKIFRKIHV